VVADRLSTEARAAFQTRRAPADLTHDTRDSNCARRIVPSGPVVALDSVRLRSPRVNSSPCSAVGLRQDHLLRLIAGFDQPDRGQIPAATGRT